MSQANIRRCIEQSLDDYFADLKDAPVSNLHGLFIAAVEASLIEAVLKRTNYNQSRAASWLGLNRNTLRKKLLEYQIHDK